MTDLKFVLEAFEAAMRATEPPELQQREQT